MSNLVLQRQLAARKFKVKVGKMTFHMLRPRPGDMVRRSGDELHALAMLSDFVVGWSGVTEADLIVSGGPEDVEFRQDIWINWLYEHSEVWDTLSNALLDEMDRNAAKLEEAAKNLQTG